MWSYNFYSLAKWNGTMMPSGIAVYYGTHLKTGMSGVIIDGNLI